MVLWFILLGDLFYVLPCIFLFLCFSVLLVLRLPHLGKRELTLVLFVHFVQFVLVWFCRFPLPFDFLEGLRFVIVALPGLFFIFSFFFHETSNQSSCRQFKIYIETTQVMSQSRSTALQRHQRKERWGTNKDNTTATHEITDAQRRTVTGDKYRDIVRSRSQTNGGSEWEPKLS